jgi:hypothetical protein
LGWVFSGLSGYGDIQARQEYRDFMGGIEGLKALHLCASVNLPYLLSLGNNLLSFDAYQIELMPKEYARAVADFLNSGGVISWGIVPTDSATLDSETPEKLARLLTGYWEVVSKNYGLLMRQIAEQALVAPARCCLKNLGRVGATGETATRENGEKGGLTSEEQVVGKAFNCLKMVSAILKDKFGLTS